MAVPGQGRDRNGTQAFVRIAAVRNARIANLLAQKGASG